MEVSGSVIQLSCHLIQSEVVTQRLRKGSKSLTSLLSLSYYNNKHIMHLSVTRARGQEIEEDFPPFLTIVVCSLVCLCTLIAYIANNMDPDQTAPVGAVWSWFIVFASMVKFLGVHLDMCSRPDKQTIFSCQKYWQEKISMLLLAEIVSTYIWPKIKLSLL